MGRKTLNKKIIMLLSGGLDSVANLYLFVRSGYSIELALTFDYGQRAVAKEIAIAKYHSHVLRIPHQVIRLPFLKKISSSALNNKNSQLPLGKEVILSNVQQSKKTALRVWVPNRNGLFLNIAAMYADAFKQAKYIGIGFNQEEAQTFSDNSHEFCEAANAFFSYSTQYHPQVVSLTLNNNKQEIVKKIKNIFSLATIWPCYQNRSFWCGMCESCQRFKRAIISNHLSWEDYVTKNQIFIRSLRNL